MRVNASTSKQSMITIVGKNILLITDNGSTLVWVEYVNGLFITLAQSSIKTGSGNFTQVTVVYGLQTMTLFEDGVFTYSREYSWDVEWQAIWSIQLSDVGTAFSADLANLRCLPLAMPYPPLGKYNVYNYKFDSRVVTLSKGDQTGPIVGSAFDAPASNIQEVSVCVWAFHRRISDRSIFSSGMSSPLVLTPTRFGLDCRILSPPRVLPPRSMALL
jgi:hypothetical protein